MSWTRRALLSAGLVAAIVGSGPALAAKRPPGDPPGNNGTIKVVATDPSDPDPGNEPQLDTCMLWLEFYGFDAGQTAEVIFNAHAPTAAKELLRWTGTISDDAAGGGGDDDNVIGFNLTSALQGLEAHPQQGYHVKVTSDALEAPGGPKQKVFWMNCAAEPPGSLVVTKATEGAAGPGPFAIDVACNHTPLDRVLTIGAGESASIDNVPAGTLCVATEPDRAGADSVRMTEAPADDAADGKVSVRSGPATTLTVTNVFPGGASTAGSQAPVGTTAAPAGTGTQVAGAALTQDAPPVLTIDALPRTGGSPWRAVAVALLLMVAGALAKLGSRQRSAVS